MEIWEFLQAYCLTGGSDDRWFLACVLQSAKLSGCQHVCRAQEFDLVLVKNMLYVKVNLYFN